MTPLFRLPFSKGAPANEDNTDMFLYARSVPLGIGIKCAEYTTVSILLASGMHTESLHLRKERAGEKEREKL